MRKKIAILSFFSLHPKTAHNQLLAALWVRKKKNLEQPVSRDPETPEATPKDQDKKLFGRKLGVGLVVLALAMLPLQKVFAAAYVTLDSFSGHPTTLHVSGGGWNPGETVSIYLNSAAGSPVAAAAAGGDSFFGPLGVVVPNNTAQGPLPIVAVGGTSHLTQTNSYYVVPFTASITPAPGLANTPGSAVGISGSGFAPNEVVNFSINSLSGGHATADTSGSFTAGSFTIPSVAAGTYVLHATGASSGADAINYFYVGGFYPAASPSGYYFLPGDAITFSGSGFAPGESISVTQGASPTVLSTITANASGSFTNTGSITMPNSFAGGVRTFHLHGNMGNLAPDILVTVDVFNGQISPSSYFIAPGGILNFSGHGFAKNETVKVFVGAVTAATFTADAAGGFLDQGNISIPFSYAGTSKTFTVKGQTSNTTSSVDITVGGFFPNINPSSYFVLPGQTFSISGSGFAPSETINVTLNGGSSHATSTDSSGSFTLAGPFTAPFSGGPLHMLATGALSGATANVDVGLGGLYPLVSPSAYYVLPGSNITFSGSGFAPNETVKAALGATNLGNIPSNATGSFSGISFPIAAGSVGAKTFTFTGLSSAAAAHVDVTVAALAPYGESDSYYATAGSVVHVKGHGFVPGESITILGGSGAVTTAANTLGDTPLVAVTLPLGGPSPVNIKLTGDLSGASLTLPITIAPFMPQIIPSLWYTAPGGKINFSGTGFASLENVHVTLNGANLTDVTTSTSGSFSLLNLQIPFNATMAHFVFTPAVSGGAKTVDVGLAALNPGIWLSSYYGLGGTPLTVFGGGFAPGETVNVNFDGASLGSIASDNGGNFALVTTVPFSAAGNKTVQVHGASSGLTSPAITFTQPQVFVNLQLGAYSGAPGDAINFIGSGFLPNEPVNITTDRTASTIVKSFNAGPIGNFNNSSYLAPAPGGPLTLTVTGTQSFTSKNIVYYVTGP